MKAFRQASIHSFVRSPTDPGSCLRRPCSSSHRSRLAALLAMLSFLLFSREGRATTEPLDSQVPQVIEFQVAIPREKAFSSITIELERLGGIHLVELVDDGSVSGDMPWDGVYLGRHVGEYARYVNLRLRGKPAGGESLLLFAGVVATPDRHLNEIGFQLVERREGSLDAVRSSFAYPDNRMAAVKSLYLLAGFGWGLLLLCYVGWLVSLHRKGTDK